MTDTNEKQLDSVEADVPAEAPAPPVDVPQADLGQGNDYDEPRDDDSEARSGIPAGHLVAGGATAGTVVLGLLYQLVGVPGLVAGGVAAGGGVVAYVRHRRNNGRGTASRTAWGLGAADRSRATVSRSIGSVFGGGKARRSAGSTGSGLFGGGSGSRSAGRRSSGLLGTASAGRTPAGKGGPAAAAGKPGHRAGGGTDTAHGSAGPIRRGARAFGRATRATGHGIGRAALATGRGARRAATWVNDKTGGRAGRAARATMQATAAGARKAAIWADRATGRRVSTAYRAATAGKDRSFRARRRRAAAVLGWHGPVTGPVLALVAVLVEAWRRRKARKAKAAETEGAEETTAEETAETASEGSQDTPDETPKSQIFDEPTTATCSRCGRTHTVTLADDEIERIVTCPCGHRIRFYRDPGAFDPPEDTTSTASTGQDRRRPHTAPTSTYTRRNHTMSANPLAAAAAELNAAAAAHAPADMWQVAREMDQLHEIPANVGMALRTYTMRLQGEYPIHPLVVEALGELYMAHAQLVERAQEIAVQFRTVHAEDLKREESPRINEQAWNV